MGVTGELSEKGLPSEDPYSDGTCAWWHLSEPSPELREAVEDGWLPAEGTVLDVGCGLGTELGWMVERGHAGIGIDLSEVACTRAQAQYAKARFMPADVRCLPFRDGSFEIALDRGCFHYLPLSDRLRYDSELRRVLKPGGRLLLRASLRAAGVRNDITEDVIRSTFADWEIHSVERAEIPSDTRLLEVLVVRLERRR
ncbi:MAG: class I SAM-dependent methyltransferase [Candidatus Dormiibacterota bacterium]